MNAEVDAYFANITRWIEASKQLREVLLASELEEAKKWGMPCYVHEGSNIVLMQNVKDFVALMFFKGALLEDKEHVLKKPGEHSRSGRRLHYTTAEGVVKQKELIEDFVKQAIAIEEKGLEVPKEKLELAEELKDRLDEDPDLKAAFEGLTPGRQRGYNLYVLRAKQAKTRRRRVEKHVPKILEGKGLHDR